MMEPLLRVENLSVDYVVGAGVFHALQEVSFELLPSHVLGIVGETGCGKSTLANAIPRLLPDPPARLRSGRVLFRGLDLLALPKWQLPRVRGTGISMVFQEPINSLNPAYRIHDQIAEAIRIRHLREQGKAPGLVSDLQKFDYSRRPTPTTSEVLTRPLTPSLPESVKRRLAAEDQKELRHEVLEYLKLVRINDPETILDLYPHELSGGMRQRIMIAMALSGRPSLLIADEPTSALDVTIQAQVLTLMKELMDEVQTSILFISHDLGVIAEMADDLGIMYAGRLVELGPVAEIFGDPRHPYTKALLKAAPARYKAEGPLPSLPGAVPNLSRLPVGCAFHPRCVLARGKCRVDPGPDPLNVDRRSPPVHTAACYFHEEVRSIA